MKKVMALLLVLLLIALAACAEDVLMMQPLQMEWLDMYVSLSQTEFTGPQEVEVTISVHNFSAENRPGPLAVYYPDGTRIAEIGTPTLKGNERLEWKGTWFVTQEQIDAGRVTFAIQYTGQDGKGGTCVKTGTVSASIISLAAGEIPLSPVLVLEGSPTTGFEWQWEIDGDNVVNVSSEYVNDTIHDIPDTLRLGGGGKYLITLTGLQAGEATITFNYARVWIEDTPIYTLVYRVRVDEALNVTILSCSFGNEPDTMFLMDD